MKSKKSALLRMDNVGIIVDDLKAVVAFFTELGLELEASDPNDSGSNSN